jgi:hypothetical protein
MIKERWYTDQILAYCTILKVEERKKTKARRLFKKKDRPKSPKIIFKKETDGWIESIDMEGDKRWNLENVLYQRPFKCYSNWSPLRLCVLSVERVNCACTAGSSNSTSIPYIYPHNTWDTVSYITPQPAWSEITTCTPPHCHFPYSLGTYCIVEEQNKIIRQELKRLNETYKDEKGFMRRWGKREDAGKGRGGGDEKRRYIPMRSAAAMMMRNDDILTRRGGKNGEDRLESLSLLPPPCRTGCLTSKKSDKDPLTGCPWNILLFLLSLYVYHCVSLTAFVGLSQHCVLYI